MSRRPPIGFILSSQAALCEPEGVSYRQLWEEVQAGTLVVDPSLTHDGVWLLDHAIAMRSHSSAGQRGIRQARGADPDMDRLWARWFSLADPSQLGDEEKQAGRIVMLLRVGSSLCLDLALARGVDALKVKAKWNELLPSSPHRDPLSHCILHDWLPAASVLVKHGWASRCDLSLLAKSKSVDMLDLLLCAVADPAELKLAGLTDQLLSRGLAASELEKMIRLVHTHDQTASSPEDWMRRLASGLEKKSLEQMRVEMRLASWSPSSRGHASSPIIEWARAALVGGGAAGASSSSILPWLGKQSSVAVVQPGNAWSEAAWIWAALYVRSPQYAEQFAAIAKDIPQDVECWQRVAFFHEFSQSNELPRRVEDAIVGQLGDLPWYGTEEKAQAASVRLDAWIGEGNDLGFLSLYAQPSQSLPRPLEWLKLFENEALHRRQQCMTLACWIALVQNNANLIENVEQAWEAGDRPLSTQCVATGLAQLCADRVGRFESRVQAWALEHLSPIHTQALRSQPRL